MHCLYLLLPGHPEKGNRRKRVFFVSKEQFEKMRDEQKLIEYAQYVNHYYGTPKEYVEQKMAEGKDVILEIEIQGALKVKKRFPDACCYL